MTIPSKRLAIVGGIFLLGSLFAVIGRSSSTAAASSTTKGKPSKSGSKTGGGGFSLSFGGGAEGMRVEILDPRRGAIAQRIQGPGTIQAGSEVGIGAPFEGRVSALLKDDGDTVKKGEVVFSLDTNDRSENVTDAEIDLVRKEAALAEAGVELAESSRKLLESADEPSDVTEARLRSRQSELQQERAGAQLEAAEAKLKRAQLLLGQGVGRETDVEQAASEQRVSLISLRIAKEELALANETLAFRVKTWDVAKVEAKKNVVISETRHRRAEVDGKAALLVLDKAKRELAKCSVRSPIDGVVTSRQVNLGDEVARATGDVSHYIISDMGRFLAYVDVDEGDVVKVKREQEAEVTVNALADRELKGAVYDVGYRARTKSGEEVPFFRVRILIAPGQTGLEQLRPGMTANVSIETARETEALKVPIQAVVQRERSELPDDLKAAIPEVLRDGVPEGAFETSFKELLDVVFVVKDGKTQVRVVKTGLQNEDEIEIRAGLEDDLPLVVGPYRSLEKLRHDAAVIAEPAEDSRPSEE